MIPQHGPVGDDRPEPETSTRARVAPETGGLSVSFGMANRSPGIAVGSLAILGSCSFGTVHPVDCTSNQECRSVFGLGSVCGAEGLCDTIEMHPRCQAGVPAEVVFPLDPAQIMMVGTCSI